tara:strand:+ start:178 stop:396 length:219 start_codon:yes stop_codon:yes gene_type:complete
MAGYDNEIDVNDTVNEIVMFIDKQYESIGVKDSLWVYDKEDIKREDMIYPTDLCEEIRSYLTDKLTELKGEE